MAQKVNPISLRLGKTNRNFDSCWYNQSNYVNLVIRDLQIQFYIDSVLKKLDYSSARYSVVNLPTKTKITIFSYDLNKNKYKASSMLHINSKKKTKKYKKSFNSISDTRISFNENKIFNYLTKNFYPLKGQALCLAKQWGARPCTNIAKFKNLSSDNKTSFSGNLQKKQSFSETKAFLLQKKLQQFKIKYFIVKYLNVKHTFFENINYFNNFIFKLNRNKLLMAFHYYKRNIINYLYTHQFKLNKNVYTENLYSLPLNLSLSAKKVVPKSFPFALLVKENLVKEKNVLNKFKILNYLKLDTHSKASLKLNYLKSSKILNLNNQKNVLHLATIHKNHKVYGFNNEHKFENNLSLLENKFGNQFTLNKTFYNTSRLHKGNDKYASMSVINSLKLKNINKIYFNLATKSKYFNFIYKNIITNKKIPPLKNNNREVTINEINYLNLSKSNLNNLNYGTLQNPPYKHHLESIIYKNFNINVNLLFLKTDNMFMSASFLINEIIYYIEKKVPFFKIKNYILRQLTDNLTKKKLRVKGLRVICSGRVGGKSKKAQRSKKQSFKYGETSLNIFSGKMDFKSKNAFTSFGTLGLKVWISYY